MAVPPGPAAGVSLGPIGGTGSGGTISQPQGPTDIGDPNEPGGPPTSQVAPVQLDLSGQGIAITPLTSSNTFETIGQDGYQHRTAWAGTGDAVLFVDPNNLGTIQNADQYIFTDWDPSAKTDMEALRNVFDTNHDGQLDAGDAAFAQFKLMVTNADGTTSVETLADVAANCRMIDETVMTSSAGNSAFDRTTRRDRDPRRRRRDLWAGPAIPGRGPMRRDGRAEASASTQTASILAEASRHG